MPSSRPTGLRAILLVIGRVLLAAIFILAAYGKLRPTDSAPGTFGSLKITPRSLSLSLTYFGMQIDSYQMLPSWGVVALSHILPWLELTLGVLLLAGLALRWVGLVAAALLATLFGVVLRTYLLGLQINCGCFGPSEPLTGWTIVRDGLFVVLGLAVTVEAFLQARRSRRSLTRALA